MDEKNGALKKECTIYINKVLLSYFTGIASMRAW